MTSDQKDQNQEFGARLPNEDGSVDDFIKELEAKEKDLHISSELVIEVEDADFDDLNIPDFLLEELKEKAAAPTPMAAAVVKPDTRVGDLQNEVSALKQKMSSLISERADMQERSLKRLNEFENFKNRMERERVDTFNRQLENLAMKMLPVLDNLDRALGFSSVVTDDREELQHFFEGIVLVRHQLIDIFDGMGISQISALGDEFDPHMHEAAAIVEDGSVEPNTVVAELLRGYRIGNRVIRHSMVKVSKIPTSSNLTPEPGPEEPLNETGEAADVELPDPLA